jgi:hypothetical protein
MRVAARLQIFAVRVGRGCLVIVADRGSGGGLFGVALPRGLPRYPKRDGDPVP